MPIADIRPALRSFLLADSGISTAVGGSRIFPAVLPQGETMPSVVYNRVSGQGDYHMGGASGLTRPRFQIDAWAATSGAAAALADLVKFRLDGFRGLMEDTESPPRFQAVRVQGVFLENERDDYQADIAMHRMSREYLVWFEER